MKNRNISSKKFMLLFLIMCLLVLCKNDMSQVYAAGESVSGSEKEYNLKNLDFSFKTVDGTTVSSKANGKPKVLIFFHLDPYQGSIKLFDDMSRLTNFGNVDLIAIEVAEYTKDEVIKFKNEYASNIENIEFCYSTSETNESCMWKYINLVSDRGMCYPLVVYIDKDNKIQYMTESGSGAGEIISNLKKYCDYKTDIDILPLEPIVYKITNVVSGVHVYWKKADCNYYSIYRRDSSDGFKNEKLIKNTTDTHFLDTDVKSGIRYVYDIYNPKQYRYRYFGGAGIDYLSTPDVSTRVNRSGGIGLTWNRIKGADGYAIYRKTYWGTDSWVRIATIRNPNQNKWDDTEVKDNNGKMYKYTVKALGYDDYSLMSGCRSNGRTMVRMTTRTLCSVDKVTANSVKCHWMPTKHCDGYEVRFMVGNTVYKTHIVADYKTGYKTLAGLKSGRTYKVQVRSYKKVKNVGTFYSAWSNEKYIKL